MNIKELAEKRIEATKSKDWKHCAELDTAAEDLVNNTREYYKIVREAFRPPIQPR